MRNEKPSAEARDSSGAQKKGNSNLSPLHLIMETDPVSVIRQTIYNIDITDKEGSSYSITNFLDI